MSLVIGITKILYARVSVVNWMAHHVGAYKLDFIRNTKLISHLTWLMLCFSFLIYYDWTTASGSPLKPDAGKFRTKLISRRRVHFYHSMCQINHWFAWPIIYVVSLAYLVSFFIKLGYSYILLIVREQIKFHLSTAWKETARVIQSKPALSVVPWVYLLDWNLKYEFTYTVIKSADGM